MMTDHVTTVCHAGYYQLRQLHHIIQPLTPTVAQTLVQAFISCQLNYCNSLLYGIADSQLRRLQSVQNAAVHLITGMWCTEHITPVLQSLHWLVATSPEMDFVQAGGFGPQVPPA